MWHVVHSLPWTVPTNELHYLLRGARLLQPTPRPPRSPLLVSRLNAIMKHLDLAEPCHAAVFACLTTTFFACACLGEFTTLTLNSFNSSTHITRAHVRIIKDMRQQPTTVFWLPQTKTHPHGQNVFWKKQQLICDPEQALANHFFINNNPLQSHLFAY